MNVARFKLSTVSVCMCACLLSAVCCLLSAVCCLVSNVWYLLFAVYCLLSALFFDAHALLISCLSISVCVSNLFARFHYGSPYVIIKLEHSRLVTTIHVTTV
jgi:hypothetical protein